MQGHRKEVTVVTFSPNSKYFVSVSSDNTVKLWSIHSQKVLFNLQEPGTKFTSIAFSPDGKNLAFGT
jgi:WD40 repeat protein